MELLVWLVGGGFVGWLAGPFLGGEEPNQLRDVLVGIAGGAAGGFLFSAIHLTLPGAMICTNLAAFLGSILMTLLWRYLARPRAYRGVE